MFIRPDTYTFFSVTPEGHFVTRKLHLLPRTPASVELPTSGFQQANRPALPLHNPFKPTKPRFVDQPPGEKDCQRGRIAVEEECDLGELLPGDSISGLRSRRVDDKLIGVAWSPQQLTVGDLLSPSAAT